MITYLKDRQHYEDRYDKITVEIGRREFDALLRAQDEFRQKAGITEKDDIAKMAFWWERLYWWLVEIPYLLPRWEERDRTIDSWMAEDRARDTRLATARPKIDHPCQNCGKHGLRLITKDLLSKTRTDQEAVLFMFECPSCKKRSAFWEDGTEWVSRERPCPQCGASLTMTVKTKGTLMTTTHTCAGCGYKNVEKDKLGEPEPPDPEYERYKAIFCLSDERAKMMQGYRIKWEEGMRMMDEDMKHAANKKLYDEAAKIERLKIPQLIERLRPAIELAGYIEVSFDKPELGSYVSIGLSCMDSHSEREDAKSRKVLKKAINDALDGTNWRLMSDGISYRLGYLTGKLRAYEDDADLVKLVS